MEQLIVKEKQEHIGIISLNRPRYTNTFTPAFSKQLVEVLYEMENDPEIRVVLIKANGKHFSTGIQIDQFKDKTRDEYRDFLFEIDEFYQVLAKMETLSIASVQGYCVANGAGLAFACDMCISSDTAIFGTTAINVGLICLGPAVPLIQIVGKKKAMEMVLTGDMFKAPEALNLGLINKLVPEESLEEESLAFAQKLASKSPSALRIGKKGLNKLYEDKYAENLKAMDELFADLCATEDAQEGLAAFKEKRKPVWKGR